MNKEAEKIIKQIVNNYENGEDISKSVKLLESSQPSLPLDWEKELDTAFCNEIIESNGTEGGLRDNELQMFWEGAEFLRNKAKEWFKTHLLSKVSYGSGMSEEEASEPITTALYNSGIHDTEGCSQLAENILKVIGDYGYKIVKAESSATLSDEDIEPQRGITIVSLNEKSKTH